jgi:hypothetical protein
MAHMPFKGIDFFELAVSPERYPRHEACLLGSRIALQALAIIVLWEGRGLGGMGHLGGFRLDGSSQRGIAFYAVTGKGGGNEFHQIFHRGS